MFTGRRRAINKKMKTVRQKLKAKLSKLVSKKIRKNDYVK